MPSQYPEMINTHYTLLAPPILSAAWRVQPRNYLLFACHFTNAAAQSVQAARFTNYWYMGGQERQLGIAAPVPSVTEAVKEAAADAKAKAAEVVPK